MEGQSSSWITLCLSSAAPNALSAARASAEPPREGQRLRRRTRRGGPARRSSPRRARRTPSARLTPESAASRRPPRTARRPPPGGTCPCPRTARRQNAAAAGSVATRAEYAGRDSRRRRETRCFVVLVRGRKARLERVSRAPSSAPPIWSCQPSGGHLLHRKHGANAPRAEGVAARARRRRLRVDAAAPAASTRTSPPTARPARAPPGPTGGASRPHAARVQHERQHELAPSPEPRAGPRARTEARAVCPRERLQRGARSGSFDIGWSSPSGTARGTPQAHGGPHANACVGSSCRESSRSDATVSARVSAPRGPSVTSRTFPRAVSSVSTETVASTGRRSRPGASAAPPPELEPGTLSSVSTATCNTEPTRSRQYGGVSVHPPARLSRAGYSARTVYGALDRVCFDADSRTLRLPNRATLARTNGATTASRNARRAIASASLVSSSEDASASATRPTASPALLSPAGAHSSAHARAANAAGAQGGARARHCSTGVSFARSMPTAADDAAAKRSAPHRRPVPPARSASEMDTDKRAAPGFLFLLGAPSAAGAPSSAHPGDETARGRRLRGGGGDGEHARQRGSPRLALRPNDAALRRIQPQPHRRRLHRHAAQRALPGFFTPSSTQSATQVQQCAAAQVVRGSETPRDFRAQARGGGGGGAERQQCRKVPGGTRAPCGRSTSCSRQPSPTTVCLPRSQCATRLPAPTRRAHPGRHKHEPTPTPAPRPTASAPTLGIRDVPGGSIFSTSQVPSAMPALGGERGQHVVVARAVLQQLGHRADVHEARRHEREREQGTPAHRLRQQLARAAQLGLRLSQLLRNVRGRSVSAGTHGRDVVRPAQVAGVRVLAHGLHQVAVRAHLDAGERRGAAATATSANTPRRPRGTRCPSDPLPALPSAYPESLGPGSWRRRAHRRDGGFQYAGTRRRRPPASAPATALRTHASSCSRSQTKTPRPVPTSTEEACASASMPCSARDGGRAEPRERAELHGDVGAADEDSARQARWELLERHELRLQHGRGDANTRGVERELSECLAQRAVRGGTLAVPAGVQQEELLGAPPAPDESLQAKHHVQGRASAAHSRAGGVGDDQVPLARTRELSPRVQRVQLLDVGLGLAVVRRGEHHRVPEPAIRARAIAPSSRRRYSRRRSSAPRTIARCSASRAWKCG